MCQEIVTEAIVVKWGKDRRTGATREGLGALLVGGEADDSLEVLTNSYLVLVQFQEASELQGCLIGNLAAEIGSAESQCCDAARAEMAARSRDVTVILSRGQAEGHRPHRREWKISTQFSHARWAQVVPRAARCDVKAEERQSRRAIPPQWPLRGPAPTPQSRVRSGNLGARE